VLYEIHEVTNRQPVHPEIVRQLRRHILQAQAQHQQLLPIDAEAFWRQNQLAARDIAIIAGTAAAVALVIIFVVIQPELGVPFMIGAGSIGADGLLGAGLAAEGAGMVGGAGATAEAGLIAGAGATAAEAGVASEAVVVTRIATTAQRVRIVEKAFEIAAEVEETAGSAETMVKALPLPK
jgi:hypothetical protein